MNIIIILSVLNFIILFIVLGFLYKVQTDLKSENKQLRSFLKETFSRIDNDHRVIKKEISNTNSKIIELTSIDKME